MSENITLPPLDWKIFSLEDISSHITSGGTPTSGDARYYVEGTGLPFAKTEDLTRSTSKYVESCELSITPAALKESAAKKYPVGTILISMYGTIGLTKITACEMAANQALCALLPPFSCDRDYLFHHLEFIRNEWLAFSGQTTQANINGAVVRSKKVPLPPAKEQAVIARILDSLDTTIHQTEAIIEKLKQVKQGLLHDLLTRGIDANGELRPSQSEAPELYKESALGWIPREWVPSSVATEFSVDSGFTISPSRLPKNRRRKYLRVANVQRALLDLEHVSELEATDEEMASRCLLPGDLLIVEGHASTEEIGRCAMATEDVSGFTFQNHLFRLRALRLHPGFSLYWMNSNGVRAFWRNEAATSSGLNTINRSKLDRVLVAVPSEKEQLQIVKAGEAINHRITEESNQLIKLHAQKSGLMDDLLTGRVRVTPLLESTAA